MIASASPPKDNQKFFTIPVDDGLIEIKIAPGTRRVANCRYGESSRTPFSGSHDLFHILDVGEGDPRRALARIVEIELVACEEDRIAVEIVGDA